MEKGRLKRGFALLFSTVLLGMSVIPHLPPDILTAFAFRMNFSTSTSGDGHYDISGAMPGQPETDFLCMKKGASAKSGYDYYKTDNDVSYSEGSIEHKRLFWAYLLTYGNTPGIHPEFNDDSIEEYFGTPLEESTRVAKETAWSHGRSNGGSDLVERMANDGFMQLENIPEGCKSPQDVFYSTSNYGTPETAISISALQSAPGTFDPQKLYEMAGLKDWAAFRQYCNISADPVKATIPGIGEGVFDIKIEYTDHGFHWSVVDGSGVPVVGLEYDPVIFKVEYDKSIFRVLNVTGLIEYFETDDAADSQPFYRAFGKVEVTYPVFYVTTGKGKPNIPPTGGGGGGLGGGDSISVRIYEHKETFESHYQVDLTKYDYETGHPLKDSSWQVLEAFADKDQIETEDETDGKLVEGKMRENPTVWDNWLIFEEDMATDENGYISHKDERFYDFSHKYCDGHPIPPEPEADGEDPEATEAAEEEYAQLMEEWQAAVDECAAAESASNGTFHHWECGSESEPSEAEAFEQSGCKAARDQAYENFIHLRYSYTFREADPRNGYILHGPNGHPDDIPVEIVTIASSEAEKKAQWTQCSNEDIIVTGRAENVLGGGSKKEKEEIETAGGEKLYLTEQYKLSWGEQIINTLRNFVGLPDKFAEEYEFAVNIAAENDDIGQATASDGDTIGDEVLFSCEDNSAATASNAASSSNAVKMDLEEEKNLWPVYDYERAGAAFSLKEADPGILYEARAGYIDFDGAVMDSQPDVEKGPADHMGHSFQVYDHRVPGQIHFNKRDMQLAAEEKAGYHAYGDTQGDSTLEGAVYGLFAADDIYGPDTQMDESGNVIKGTGILFDANDLVAVAATDKNGDGSFLTITEKPHSIYNYKTGQIEYTGKEYPKNLYTEDVYRKVYDEEETGRIYKDNIGANGDCWIGRPLILGNYYIKELTRSEGFELSITGKEMEVTNPTEDNRENYGDTDDARTHPEGKAWITEKMKHVVTFPEGNETYGNRENLFDIAIRSNNAAKGFNVVFDGLPEGAEFYFDNTVTSDVTIQVPTGKGRWEDATEEPLFLTANDGVTPKKDIHGNPIKNPNPKLGSSACAGIGFEASRIASRTANPSDVEKYNAPFTDSDSNIRYVKYELEQMMRSMGIDTPKDSASGVYSRPDFPVYDEPAGGTYGMPEITINISGITTNASLINAILDYYTANQVYTYGSFQQIQVTGSLAKVTVAIGMNPKKTILYETNHGGEVVAGYLFKLNDQTRRYVLRKYTGGQIQAVPISKGKANVVLAPDFAVDENGMPQDIRKPLPGEEFLCYAPGEILYDYWYQDHSGNWVGHEPSRRKIYVPEFVEQKIEKSAVNSSQIPIVPSRESVKDPVGDTYVVYDPVSGQYTLHAGTKNADLGGVKSAHFTIAIDDGKTVLTQADIDRIGKNNVWGYKAGDTLSNSAYIMRISGAGAGVFTSEDFNQDKSFIKNQRLIYSGYFDLAEDGSTNERPNPVEERVITQEIKVTKTIQGTSYNNINSYGKIHKDWFTEIFGGLLGTKNEALKMDNFRFKIYLKSNLEGLYRDNDGKVVWLDRTGREVDQLKVNEIFPALVNKIYTRVLHKTAPLYKDSQDAIIANGALYSYQDGLINEEQEDGYTSVLETVPIEMEDGEKTRVIEAPNYDKFFDGIAVANNDKWDDGAPTYTSWKPIGNQANRSDNAIENTRVSDMVRQFAIDWYLEDEIKKLVHPVLESHMETEDADGTVGYSDELYDEALQAAIIKAENYLKPFFAYDLDEIYAVAWDNEENGGSDKDPMTLSADTLYGEADNTSEGYYYGISARLPYGTYVVAEQQPKYADLEDFKNRHYQTDKPREVPLPSVYASYEGSQQSPEAMNDYYNYSSAMAQNELERRYKIRFNEEALHLIRGRNAQGDFEVYKYGMDLERIRKEVTETGAGDYFALTQSEFMPYKNYYNPQDDRTTGDVPYYLAEGLNGREQVSKYYRYSSVAENKGTADHVPFFNGPVTKDNQPGRVFQDQVATMQGSAIAYEGKYAPMLVPWSVEAPENGATEEKETALQASGESSYKGYAYTKLRNRFYTAKLRIEKLDSETHENILHDDAIFNIYAAKRDDSPDGEGKVLFYEAPTTITGTREFLEAMGAEQIQPLKRPVSWLEKLLRKEPAELESENQFSGIALPGTPICYEAEQIILGDGQGTQTVAFQSYSTVLDGWMKKEEGRGNGWQLQTVGYLETPQPLGAGVYVLCERKAPAGYVRSRPIALEIYSDKLAYYKDGNRDERVLAAVYEYPADNQTKNGTKPQDRILTARIYVENTPIRLQVKKKKEGTEKGKDPDTAAGTVTYRVSGRLDGSLAQIGGNADYEYAYKNGSYAGYAWKKGTLEQLAARKAAGEQVEIVYEDGLFAGYGYITRPLETADDENPYAAGAKMALFEALELKRSGDTEDHAYQGLTVERDDAGNVIRMYVKKGFAGISTEFIKEKDETGADQIVSWQTGVDQWGNPLTGMGNVWTAKTVERPDTDILYYDLGGLDILTTVEADGQRFLCGYDKNHRKVQISQIESDRRTQKKNDREQGLFAFRDSVPYLEITGGDFTKLGYSAADKVITAAKGTRIYHLDRDGNRDALVDPYTGMAYAETADGSVMVWPIKLRRDADGNMIARDKIMTSRIAEAGEVRAETAYLTGSWKSEGEEESHWESSLFQNEKGQNQNEEVLVSDHNGAFEKHMNPVYDCHGLPIYYQKSKGTYDKGFDLYDRNNTFVRQQDSDHLDAYNQAAYRIQDQRELKDGNEQQEGQLRGKLYHRQGESYILENTWITSEKTPNDPFHTEMTDGQPDLLKRVPAGCYIMEELQSPAGYGKAMPMGIKIMEKKDLQKAEMKDQTIKVEIVKIDGPAGSGNSSHQEPKLAFSYQGIKGATLALFPAKRVYTSDTKRYPSGYYLEKTSQEPLKYHSTESTESRPEILTAKWTTSGDGIYLEGIPKGDYLLEELATPEGYVTSDPLEVIIREEPEVQIFQMADDHTRIEIEKYRMDGQNRKPVKGAAFTLYEAKVDEMGKPIYENGRIAYWKDRPAASWITSDGAVYRDFIPAFESMYRQYGTTGGTSVAWDSEGGQYQAEQISCDQIDASVSGGNSSIWPASAVMMFRMEDGRRIRVGIYGEQDGAEGRDFTFEYQFDYQELPGINGRASQYQTTEGSQRLEYLPARSWYVLVETVPPEGYRAAEPLAVYVKDKAEVQRYQVENKTAELLVSKVTKNGETGELAGAHLGLYRPGENGELIQDEEHLAVQWITGEDGAYSELDYINGRIPDGYKIGDLRPHRILELPKGIYWLAEMKSPDYYRVFEPVKVEHSQEKLLQVVRVTNEPAAGRLSVKKTDQKGRPLFGAVFKLQAYEKGMDGKLVLERELQGEKDQICVENLPIGKVLSDGQIEPYTYKLFETVPPNGYAVNPKIFIWEFAPDKQGVSYADEEAAWQEIVVADEKTRIEIWKIDGETKKPLAGAKFQILDKSGKEAAAWVSDGTPWRLDGILLAGETYTLREVWPPDGYQKMEDRIFTVPEYVENLVLVCRNKQMPEAPPELPDPPEQPEPPGEPDRPEEPEDTFQIGQITASYWPGQPRAAGWLYLGRNGRIRIPLPGTGQDSDGWWYGAGFFLSGSLLLGMGLFWKKRKKQE